MKCKQCYLFCLRVFGGQKWIVHLRLFMQWFVYILFIRIAFARSRIAHMSSINADPMNEEKNTFFVQMQKVHAVRPLKAQLIVCVPIRWQFEHNFFFTSRAPDYDRYVIFFFQIFVQWLIESCIERNRIQFIFAPQWVANPIVQLRVVFNYSFGRKNRHLKESTLNSRSLEIPWTLWRHFLSDWMDFLPNFIDQIAKCTCEVRARLKYINYKIYLFIIAVHGCGIFQIKS